MTEKVDTAGEIPGSERPPSELAAGALLLGIPVYLSQRRRMTPPGPVPAYR